MHIDIIWYHIDATCWYSNVSLSYLIQADKSLAAIQLWAALFSITKGQVIQLTHMTILWQPSTSSHTSKLLGTDYWEKLRTLPWVIAAIAPGTLSCSCFALPAFGGFVEFICKSLVVEMLHDLVCKLQPQFAESSLPSSVLLFVDASSKLAYRIAKAELVRRLVPVQLFSHACATNP